jgi:hypothetical protein
VEVEDSNEYLPGAQNQSGNLADVMHKLEKAKSENKCEFVDFTNLPLQLKKQSKTCQVCNYEIQKPKWKGVVMCVNHGVWLYSGITSPRCDSLPELYQQNGDKVTDWSLTCPTKTSCWNQIHDFYLPNGLFSRKELNVSQGTIKFGNIIYSLDL